MTPSHIGRYEIQRRLGAGGMGALFLARDPSLDRLVALKLLKEEYLDDAELRERFVREARSVARLRHRNIIIVYEIGQADRHPFIAMEYIAGETLMTVLRRTPPLPLTRRLVMVEELCDGLAHAHAVGIVHRDIKPANIMLDVDGVVKVLDFGIARMGDSGITQDGVMMGTVNYMSPEQVVGHRVDHRTDVYATGVVMYELIALEQAFPGRIDGGVLHRILEQGPVPLTERVRGVDAELAQIVNRALAREPGERYQDLNAMRADVSRVRQRLVAQERDLHAQPPRTLRPDERTGERKRLDPERVAQLRRQQVEEHLRFGEEAFARGEHDAALQYAERAATADPESHSAAELIDRARFEIDAKALRQLLTEAGRLLEDGQLEDAAALAEEASVTLPDLRGAPELLDEVRSVTDRITAARERERMIASSLERARASLEQGGYDTALRAVYEVLALDPERREARELEGLAKSSLQTQREQEAARRTAYDRLKAARALANDGKYDEAIETINAVFLPTHSVRLAAAEALALVRSQQRHAARAAILARARTALEASRFEEAISLIGSIPADERTADARSLLSSAEEALRAQREIDQKRRALDAALTAVAHSIDQGDLAGALERLEEAARIGIEDGRIPALRRRIAELEADAQEKRRQEARDRVAAKKVGAARQLLGKGDAYAALAVLDRDESGHPLVEQTLQEIRAAIAEQEERVRRESERRRQEEEARRRAEADAARRREEQRKAEELQRRQEVVALLALVDEALAAQRSDEAMQLLQQALERGSIEGDTALARRVTAAKVEVDRQRRARDEAARAQEEEAQRRAEEARRREEEARRREQEARRREEDARRQAESKEEALTIVLTRARHAQAHEEALDLLNQALTLSPGDTRVQTLIRQRREALERERAEAHRREEERRLEEARRLEEDARRRQDEHARRQREDALTEIITRASREDAHDVALTLLKEARTIAPSDSRVEVLIAQRDAALKHERARQEPQRTAPEPAAVHVPRPPVVQPQSDLVPRRDRGRTGIYAAAAIVVLAIGGGLLYWNQPPSEPTTTKVPDTQKPVPPVVPPPPRPDISVEERVQGHLARARALVGGGQHQEALAEIEAALALDARAKDAIALRDEMVRDAALAAQRAREGALASRADKVAATTYTGALGQERAALRERQAGRLSQALPLLWNARARFLAATDEARVAEQASRDQAGRDQAARDQAARDAARDQAEKEQAARDLAARDQTARDQAARDQAARDQAARDQAARDQAARDQAARDQAARDQARLQQLDEMAVLQTIREYQAALQRLDADAVARVLVMSGQQLADLRKSLSGARAYEIEVQIRETRFATDRRSAAVTADVKRTYVPQSGRSQGSSLVQTFTIERRGNSWVIATLR